MADDQQNTHTDKDVTQVILVSHSPIFYWWPVWLTGFIMAALTKLHGDPIDLGAGRTEYFHNSSDLGMVYVVVFLVVFVVSNQTIRGMASGLLILFFLFVSVLLAWLHLWDDVLALIPHLTVYMNFGFYIITSTFLFIVWALIFLVFDRLSYWRIVPGQATKEKVIGGGEESYDTGGLVLREKHDDFFKHWLLGFGAGDIRITTGGAENKRFYLANVLFADAKVSQAQQLINRKPD